jgi:hypothetical protein
LDRESYGTNKVFEKDGSGKMLKALAKRRNPARRRQTTQASAHSSTGSCEAQSKPDGASSTGKKPPMRLQQPLNPPSATQLKLFESRVEVLP